MSDYFSDCDFSDVQSLFTKCRPTLPTWTDEEWPLVGSDVQFNRI